MRYSCQPARQQQIEAHVRTWLERAVIGLNLCPFARGPYLKDRVCIAITAASHRDEVLAELDDELSRIDAPDGVAIETTLLVLPDLLHDFVDFHFFVDEANALLRRRERDRDYQLVAFHPRFEFADSRETVDNLVNRAPYPILQLLREASVSEAVRQIGDASVIYEANIATVRALGESGWNALFDQQGDAERR